MIKYRYRRGDSRIARRRSQTAPTSGKDRFTCFYKSWIRRNAPPRIPLRVKIEEYAGMVELVDSVDLGSTARACRFESCCPHQKGFTNVKPFFIPFLAPAIPSVLQATVLYLGRRARPLRRPRSFVVGGGALDAPLPHYRYCHHGPSWSLAPTISAAHVDISAEITIIYICYRKYTSHEERCFTL